MNRQLGELSARLKMAILLPWNPRKHGLYMRFTFSLQLFEIPRDLLPIQHAEVAPFSLWGITQGVPKKHLCQLWRLPKIRKMSIKPAVVGTRQGG